MQTVKANRRNERLGLRPSKSAKVMLQQAATLHHESLGEFVVESSLNAARETLADRSEFMLSDEQWSDFLAALDAPTSPKPKLEGLLNNKSVFE